MKGVVMKKRYLIIPLLLMVGCVSKSKDSELQSQYQEQVSTVEKQQQRIADLEQQIERERARAKARVEAFQQLMREFKPLVDRGLLEVKVEDGRIIIGMAADVLFPSGSAELSAEGRSNVAEVAKLLARHRDREFQVEGHTDSDAISTKVFPNNWYLARAINVVEFMISSGMAPEQISAASFSDTRPVAPNTAANAKALNRRIEIVVLPDMSDLPGYEELMKAGKPGPNARPRRKSHKRKK